MGSAYLEIVEEESEFTPRAVGDRSVDGDWFHQTKDTYHQPITTRSGTTKIATC